MKASPLARLVMGALALAFGAGAQGAEPVKPVIPVLIDPAHHPAKPDFSAVKSIRFLTSDDFPPLHFTLGDGTPAGFDIDLARAICDDLKIACTIQARRFDTLIGALKNGQGDALIAAVANTAATRADLAFTAPYYTTPARFVVPRQSALASVTPEVLAGHTVGVQASTAHLAFLQAFYPGAKLQTFPNQAALRGALRDAKVEAIFADGLSLALWLNGDAQNCCAFKGGPYTESYFFGNGGSIAVSKGNEALRQILDYELDKLAREGKYADLYLKYFPIGFY
jgi:polar amino acid transport system substrate-binding protein